MSVATLSKLLPYALLAFIGVAGWTMGSQLLLATVVIGTVGVAIGTSSPRTGKRTDGAPQI